MRFEWRLLRRTGNSLTVVSRGASPSLRWSLVALIREEKALGPRAMLDDLHYEVDEHGRRAAQGPMITLPTDPAQLSDSLGFPLGKEDD